jgi:Flp pilus assembly protein TadG
VIAPAESPDGPERGAVTAEFAVALPVLVVVAALVLGVAVAGGLQIRLQTAAAAIARAAGRDDDTGAVAGSMAPGAAVTMSGRGVVVCATLVQTASVLGPIGVPVRATGCAPTGGR